MPNPSGKRKYDYVDLTDDGDTDLSSSQSRKVSRHEVPSSQSERNTWVNAARDEDYDDEEYEEILGSSQDFDDSYELYGTMNTKIVGIRYYNGRATKGEMVVVRREPTNPYDSNAIRISNMAGNQVGHLPRQMAVKLAPYMDDRSLHLEGKLAGEKGEYNCPISVSLFGPSRQEDKIRVKQRLEKDRLPLNELKKREDAARRRNEEVMKRLAAEGTARKGSSDMQWTNGSQYSNGSSQGKKTAMPAPPTMNSIIQGSQQINPRAMSEVVEKFGTGEEALAKMPMADPPPGLAAQLLPFQSQGLRWMIEQENPQLPEVGSQDVTQMWKRADQNSDWFLNIATNYSTKIEPPLASGGILADDMGLGKTIQIISLILADAATNPATPGSHGTLIVCPVSVMSNWSGQIERHVMESSALRVLTYHGAGKKVMGPHDFNDYDVVITSYGTLSTEYRPRKKEAPAPIPRPKGLFSLNWRRIILDEGHTIRNPNSLVANAASGLMARSRWVLTGTPIINSLRDLFSMVRFLRLTGGLERLDIFHAAVIRPVNSGDPGASILLQALMRTICLRRKKEMSFIDLRLPELSEYVHRVTFLPDEREKYEGLQKEAKGLWDTYKQGNVQGGSNVNKTYHHLLETLLRLRQVCNHWKLCEKRITALLSLLDSQKSVDLSPENRRALQDMLQLSIESQDECPVCLETLRNPIITACGHAFDFECIERVIETQHRCPLCRVEIADSEGVVRPPAEGDEIDQLAPPIEIDSSSSSKIEALIGILRGIHEKTGNKVVIFSQWTSFLNILQRQLDKYQFKYTRLDGTMSAKSRDAAMVALETDPECTIMLASLAVCSVGLNLVAANHVILADSWWAPAIEDQAVDRVHRLGQKRTTSVFRLVMEGSIEERVLDIQAEKRKLMMTAFQETNSKRKTGRTMRDIGNLLS
ncbi:MAG: rRNA-binding ribosome biosynthesis protein utp25 [Chaenotheca gracillima]|nr:MAG: rRNA-binding ribosome biosynthesis protein utp25 [Chaenotheca gracillima]